MPRATLPQRIEYIQNVPLASCTSAMMLFIVKLYLKYVFVPC